MIASLTKMLDRLTRRVERLEAIEIPRLPVLREVRLDVFQVRNGASAPSTGLRAVGASGGVQVPVLSFSSVIQQDVYFEFHAPTDLNPGKPVHLHVMWQPASGWTSGTYTWKLEYLVKDENGATLLSGTPTTITQTITPTNATTWKETEYPDNITLGSDQVAVCHFYRDVADTGNAAGEVRWWELEYESNRLGEYF